MLFRLVRHFEATHPQISLESREFDFSDPTAGLADGTTEVAIIRPPVDLPEHRMLILDAENWVACLPRDHRLAQRSEVSISELLDDPVVVAPGSAGRWRDYWMAMDARDGTPPTITAVAATYEEQTTTVARGLGISFTSEASARLYNRQGIAYVPIVDRRRNYTALAWHPARLSKDADALTARSATRRASRKGSPRSEQRPITDELMAVTTAGGVTPINSLDDEPIGSGDQAGEPDPLTVAIRDRFWALMDEPGTLIEAIEY